MTDFELEQAIRAMASVRIRDFEAWTTPVRREDNFGEAPWLDIIATASLALIAVDKNLKAADGVIDRLSRLYRWVVKKDASAKPTAATLSEILIVALTDQRARVGTGISTEDLATETVHSIGDVEKALERLKTLSIAIESDGGWILRRRDT